MDLQISMLPFFQRQVQSGEAVKLVKRHTACTLTKGGKGNFRSGTPGGNGLEFRSVVIHHGSVRRCLVSVAHDGSGVNFGRFPKKYWIVVCAAACLLCLPGARATDRSVADQCDEIVARYRKIIVLMDGSSKLDPAVKAHVATAGRMLFEENHQARTALEKQLEDSLAAGKTDAADEFLSRVEKDDEYLDADKLVFHDTLEGLGEGPGSPGLKKRVQEDLSALAAV